MKQWPRSRHWLKPLTILNKGEYLKTGALIPIRLGSERLHRKAIRTICGKPVVYHLLDRVAASKHLDKKDVVVCTTEDSNDDDLVRIVEKYGARCFRGSTDDLIHRFFHAMKEFKFDAVIQVDGDDPLCDTYYMDLTLERLLGNSSLDIVLTEGLPLGVNSKSFTWKAMQTVYDHYKTEKNDTGFIYFFTKTGLCNIEIIKPEKKEHVLDEARLTLDYEEDFLCFEAIFNALYRENQVFGIDDFVPFLKANPQIMQINNQLNEKYFQRHAEKSKFEFEDMNGSLQQF